MMAVSVSTVLDADDNEDDPNKDDDDANRCWALVDLLRIVVASTSWRLRLPSDLVGSATNPGDGYDKENTARDDDAAATAAVVETTAIIGRLLVGRKSVMIMQLTMMLIAAIVPALQIHPNPISFTDTYTND